MNARLVRRIIGLLLAALLLTGIVFLAGGTAAAQIRVQRRVIVVRPIRPFRSFILTTDSTGTVTTVSMCLVMASQPITRVTRMGLRRVGRTDEKRGPTILSARTTSTTPALATLPRHIETGSSADIEMRIGSRELDKPFRKRR